MRYSLIIAIAVLFTQNAARADDKAERAKFKGKWVAASLKGDGMEIPPEMLQKVPWYWIVDDQKIISKRPGKTVINDEELEFVIDPAAAPKSINLTDKAKKETFKGIYEFKDDTLKVCFTFNMEGKRPSEFSAEKDSKQMVIVWKRVKD